MSTRPEGTDGSDHMYRQTVNKDYVTLANKRNMAMQTLKLEVLFYITKTLWVLLPVYLYNGMLPSIAATTQILIHLPFLFLWWFSGIGTSKQRFWVVKLTSIVTFVVTGQHMLYLYVASVLTPMPLRTTNLVLHALNERFGFEHVHLDQGLKIFNGLLDGNLLLILAFLFYNIHGYITVQTKMNTDRMEAKKRERAAVVKVANKKGN